MHVLDSFLPTFVFTIFQYALGGSRVGFIKFVALRKKEILFNSLACYKSTTQTLPVDESADFISYFQVI